MATSWMLVSGFFGAMSNLCMRRSMDAKGTAKAFFVFQLTCTMLVAIALHPLRTGYYGINSMMVLAGFLSGIALGLMKVMIGKALQKGSASLTFAAVNSACVLPAIVLGLLFQTFLDVHFTSWNLLGSLLIVIGLFWAGWDESRALDKRAWAFFATGAFAMHVLFLVLHQWRSLVVQGDVFSNVAHIDTQWFVPATFAAAAGIHAVLFLFRERRVPSQHETFWGIAGGLCNGICAFLFTYSGEIASSQENAFLFPVFCITLIIVCNIWGQWLYDEEVNWRANALCLAGLIVGLVDWRAVTGS